MEGETKDRDESALTSAEQSDPGQTDVNSEAASPKIELRPSAPLANPEGETSESEGDIEPANSDDDKKFETSGSKKIIEPSSEFRSEMTQGDGQDEADGQPSSEAAPSDSNANDDPAASESSNSADSAEQRETPSAVRDFINSENPQDGEQSGDTVAAVPAPAELAAQPAVVATDAAENPSNSPNAPLATPQDAATAAGSASPEQAVASTAIAAGNTQQGAGAGKRPSKRGLIWAIIAVVVAILGASAFAFLYFLPNRPSAVFDSSLSRTGQAVDKLILYSQGNYLTDFQSFGVKGNLTINGKNYNLNSDLTGSYDKTGNTTTNLNIDSKIEGNTNSHLKVGFGLETIKPEGQTYPDVYFKLSGISDLLDQLGASGFDKYDGKWIVISHDVIKNYVDSAAGSGTNLKSPEKAQIFDAMNKAQAVSKDYLFTDNRSKSVLVNRQYIGPETKFGRSTYHYKVGFNKAHLLAYVDALQGALNSSSLNDWAKANLKHDLVQQSDVKDAKAAVNKIKDSTTFDLWADRSTKLIEAVQFVTTDVGTKTVTTLAQTYDGGDNYPFKMIISNSDSQSSDDLEMNLNINALSHEAKLDFTFNNNKNGDKTTASGGFTVSPSSDKVNPTKPANAEPFENVLQDLGFNVDGSVNDNNPTVAETRQKSSDADLESTAFIVRSKLGVYYADHGAYPADIQAVDDWLISAEGGSNAELAGEFTSANGFSYAASKSSFVIKYKLSDGSVKSINNF